MSDTKLFTYEQYSLVKTSYLQDEVFQQETSAYSRGKEMKLTKKILDRLILEALEEHRGVPKRDEGIKGQEIDRRRKVANAERTRKERERKDSIYPGARELISLSRGILQEQDLVGDDDDEFVKINRKALHRLLKEQTDPSQVQAYCSARGYKSMRQWLEITNAFADAGKGKFQEDGGK